MQTSLRTIVIKVFNYHGNQRKRICLDSNKVPRAFYNISFGLSEKMKSISAKQNLISKGLSYLLHVNSIGLSPVSSD